MKPRVRYFGHIGTISGYGQVAHDYLMAIKDLVDLDIRLAPDAKLHLMHERYAPLRNFINAHPGQDWPTHIISHTIPSTADAFLKDPLGQSPAKRVVLTTWETDKFPKYQAEILGIFDTVIVPCAWNRDVMAKAGIKAHVIPHTLSIDWLQDLHKRWLDADWRIGPHTIFYTVLTWAERKNPIGLLKAYLTEFSAEDSVLLQIVTPSVDEKELKNLIQWLGVSHELPKVQFIGLMPGRLTDEEVAIVHFADDCYVTVSRAEGWGLGAFQAAITGKRVIAPQYGGFVDFLDSYNNKTYLPYTVTPAITPESVSPNMREIAGVKISIVLRNTAGGIQGDQSWTEPDLAACKRAMRVFHSGRMRQQPQPDFVDRFRYEKVGPMLVEALG